MGDKGERMKEWHDHGFSEEDFITGEYLLDLARDAVLEDLERRQNMNTQKFVYVILETGWQGFTKVAFASLDRQKAQDHYVGMAQKQFAGIDGVDISSDWDFDMVQYMYEELKPEYSDPVHIYYQEVSLS